MFKVIRYALTSHTLLALVAVQVFFQVWVKATDAPLTGMLITFWLSWKLGRLAGHADWIAACLRQARVIADSLQHVQQKFEALPPAERLAHAKEWNDLVGMLTRLHQRQIEASQTPLTPFKELFCFEYFARRRARKMARVA